jgi:hypothetical protein
MVYACQGTKAYKITKLFETSPEAKLIKSELSPMSQFTSMTDADIVSVEMVSGDLVVLNSNLNEIQRFGGNGGLSTACLAPGEVYQAPDVQPQANE